MSALSTARASWVLALLALAIVHGYFDRQIIAVLAQPIKLTLGLSDVRLSLLSGLAFGLCASIAMFPAAMIADRYDRVYLLSGGIAIWSMMTLFCGFATSFVELFIGRIGVGIGEAVLVPTTYSLIGELFDSRRRGSAVAVIVAAAPVGIGLASFLGGPLYQAIERRGSIEVLHRSFSAWQSTLMLTGAMGLILAAGCLFLTEPRRGLPRTLETRPPPAAVLSAFLRREKAFCTPFASGFALLAMTCVGALAWGPALLSRSFSLSPASSGLVLGGSMIGSGVAGAQLAGWLVAGRDQAVPHERSLLLIVIACLMQSASFGALLLAPSPATAAIGIGCVPFFLYGCCTLGANLVLQIAPSPLHARLSALLALIISISGVSAGPTVFAAVAEHVFDGPEGLRRSLGSVGMAGSLVAAFLFHLSSKSLRREGRSELRPNVLGDTD